MYDTPHNGDGTRPGQFDFLFTRDVERDYRFTQSPKAALDVERAIICLQDYFWTLIDGKGYFSFPCGKFWVTAQVTKTARQDNTGQAIYEIRGTLWERSYLGDAWFRFVFGDRVNFAGGEQGSFPAGDYEASENRLADFLRYCSQAGKPVSWAYGVKTAENDRNGLRFDVRFVRSRSADNKLAVGGGTRYATETVEGSIWGKWLSLTLISFMLAPFLSALTGHSIWSWGGENIVEVLVFPAVLLVASTVVAICEHIMRRRWTWRVLLLDVLIVVVLGWLLMVLLRMSR